MFDTTLSRFVDALLPPPGALGQLTGMPVSARAFHHGERTADLGRLGDITGVIEVWPDSVNAADELVWKVTDSLIGQAAERPVLAGADPQHPGRIRIRAGKPWLHVLRVFRKEPQDRFTELGRVPISVPAFVEVTADAAFLQALDETLQGVQTTRDDALRRIRAVAHHILRPANVRLIWEALGEVLPVQFQELGTGTTAFEGIVTGVSRPPAHLEGSARQWLSHVALRGPVELGGLLHDGLNPWGEEGGDVPLGSIRATRDLVPDVGPGHALEAVQNHLRGLGDPVAGVEQRLRWLGVALARAVLRQIGVRENSAIELGDIMSAEPGNPVRELLGVDSGGTPAQFQDLVPLYHTLWGLDATQLSSLDVLAGVTATRSLEDTEFVAPLGPAYGGYHLRLEDRDGTRDPWNAAAAATAGPRYGGRVVSTNAAPPGALPAADEAFVARLQRDLRFVGIGLAPVTGAALGSMGPTSMAVGGRANRNDTQYRTEWSVREFQGASGYPNAARDRLLGATPYSDNLEPVENPGPSAKVTGVVDHATAQALRAWRFKRLRHPVVIEAWTMSPAGLPTGVFRDTAGVLHDNVWDYTEVENNQPRMLVRDLSGFDALDDVDPFPTDETVPVANPLGVGGGGDRHTIGQWSPWPAPPRANTWGGPNMLLSHALDTMEMLPERCIPGVANVAAMTPDQTSVFKVMRAIGEAESRGYLDVGQSYDNAVMSAPLFHYTLGLGSDAQNEGEMPGLLAYLYHASPDRYRRFFGDAGLWFSHIYGRVTQGNRGATYRGGNEEKQMGKAILLGRALRPAGQIEGDLERRPWRTTDNRRGYVQWFRTWHWFYRQIRAVRASDALRRDVYTFGLRRVADVLGHTVNNVALSTILTSEMAVAMAIRVHVRGNGNAPANRYWETVQQAAIRPPEPDLERARIRSAFEYLSGAGSVETSTTDTAEWSASNRRGGRLQQLVAGLTGAQINQRYGNQARTTFARQQTPQRRAGAPVVVGGQVQWQNGAGQVIVNSRLSVAANSFPAVANIGAPALPDLFTLSQPDWDRLVDALPAWENP